MLHVPADTSGCGVTTIEPSGERHCLLGTRMADRPHLGALQFVVEVPNTVEDELEGLRDELLGEQPALKDGQVPPAPHLRKSYLLNADAIHGTR
jgi:hypothetical protein